MIKKLTLASVIALSLTSTTVLANEAETGFVFDLYGGYSHLKDFNVGPVNVKSKGGPSIGGLLGFDWAINPMFSIGLEYNVQYNLKH